MKGKLALADIQQPKEGMQVVWDRVDEENPYEVCTIKKIFGEKIELEGEYKFFHLAELHVLKQIVLEYEEPFVPNPDAVFGERIRETKAALFPKKVTLPLHPDDWEWAIEHIGEEVEFQIDPTTPMGMKYGQEQYSTILQQTYGNSAKLVKPAPKTYTSEEAIFDFTQYLYNYENPHDYADNPELLRKLIKDWWEQHKKK
jgi:hypothetical protein